MFLVTGASGFIGARVVERLSSERIPVTALIRRLGTSGAARVASLPGVRIVHGDVSDNATMDAAARGCDVIVHCALDRVSTMETAQRVTIEGAVNVLAAARAHGARRIVNLSTGAVHSWSEPGTWNEDAPIKPKSVYAETKYSAEQLLLRNHDIPVTVLRPTCVYGPFSRTWTEGPIELMRYGFAIVSEDNSERANLIYIDNLVDLILTAANAPDRDHHVYIATEDQPHEWESLFSAYARTIGLPLLRYRRPASMWGAWRDELTISAANSRILLGRLVADVRRPLLQDLIALQRHVPLLLRARGLVPASAIRKMSAAVRRSAPPVAPGAPGAPVAPDAPDAPALPVLRPFPTTTVLNQYGARATFTAERARRELGWTPRVPPAIAIERTCAWIAFAGL